MPTYPLPTLACTVTPSGITAPAIEDIINSIIASLQSIFGSDVVLTPDTQDYQDIAIRAAAINDSNMATIAMYQLFNPAFSEGVQQDTTYKLDGIQREKATFSTVPATVTGVGGTPIPNGVVQDNLGNLWDLPPATVIPGGGSIVVTLTAETLGALSIGAQVFTPFVQVPGWQSTQSFVTSTTGAPVEQDGAFRQRQTISVSLPASTPLQAIAAAIANLAGVTRSIVYENPTGAIGTGSETPTPLVVGQPPHSICAVAAGSATAAAISQVIEATKAPGTGTSTSMAGITVTTVFDPSGVPIDIGYYPLTATGIDVSLSIHPLSGFVAATLTAIKDAIVAFINGLAIGETVYYNWLFGPASLYGSGLEFTYKITALTIGVAPAPVGVIDIPISFNAATTTVAGNIVITEV